MTVLMWDKPKKVKSTADWAESAGFEDGPTGGYVPNMSDEDMGRWKAKLTGVKLGFPQVEIRKTAGAQMTIIVSLGDGYNYKSYKARSDRRPHPYTAADYAKEYPTLVGHKYSAGYTELDYTRMGAPTYGFNVHISLNGPAQMTFEEFEEMHQAIAEAKAYLEALT